MAGQLLEYIGGPCDGESVVTQQEGRLRLTMPGGAYVSGVQVIGGQTSDVLIWEPDADLESYGL